MSEGAGGGRAPALRGPGDGAAEPAPRWVPWALAAAVLATRLPYLAHAYTEVDEYQFGAALADFDVRVDRPHPPGYPVFIVLGRIVRLVLHDPVRSLTALSALACVGATLLVARLARRYVGERESYLAALLFAANPVVWITSLRALTELTGVCATLAALVLFLGGDERRSTARLVAGALVGAAAVGIRSASCFVVLPALAWVTLPRLWRREWSAALAILVAFTVGNLAWLVPLIVDTGGLAPLLTAMHALAASIYEHDRVLASDPSLAKLASVLRDVWVAPWGIPAVGWGIVALAVIGLASLARSRPRAALILATFFLPYAFVDAVNLSTTRYRYHVYLVPLVATCAAAAPSAFAHVLEERWGRRILLALVLILGAWTWPRARDLRANDIPLVQAVHWLEPRVERGRAVIHRDDDFRIPLRYLQPSWRTRSLEGVVQPVPGKRNLTLSAWRDVVGEPLVRFTMEEGLARLVTIDPPEVFVSEAVVFLGSGWQPLEQRGEARWRWMEDRAALQIVRGGDSASARTELAIDAAAPAIGGAGEAPTLVVIACDALLAPTPLSPGVRATLRVPLPADCLAQSVAPVTLAASRAFVPAEHDPASSDRRRLALQVFRIDLVPPGG